MTVAITLGVVAATAPLAPTSPVVAQATGIQGRGSVNQVAAWGLTAGGTAELLDGGGAVVEARPIDEQGAVLFRDVPAGGGYAVRSGDDVAEDLTVTDPDQHPAGTWYDEQAVDAPLSEGYGYLTTRDGTTLSTNVTFPLDGSTGPWPVVLNYSGYDPSQPGTPPLESAMYALQGYVVVGVNMRGTGCSGGAFDFMEPLQSTDGYDVVEILARQSWSNGDVGMVGISYPGYSQLYVAATRPPSLSAITPLSPFSDTYSGILYPGGILNDGFAVDWASEREAGARPAARGWARQRIAGGDTTCADNQVLRLQSNPLLQRIYDTPFADHRYDYLNTETFIDQIQVPTYLASQWQDEQTGGSAANLVPLFNPDTTVFASFTNGAHVEPMSPSEMYEAMVFIDLYVGRRVPQISPVLVSVIPGVLASDIFGAPGRAADFALPVEDWSGYATHAEALAHYESRPRVRLRWENGAVPGTEGLPIAVATTRHANWPVDGTTNEALYLQPDGALAPEPAAVADEEARGVSSYTYDQSTKRRRTFEGSTGQVWHPHPDVRWDVLAEGHSLSFLTAPYGEPVAYAGQGSVDLWLRSSAADTDLEVTLTEVRPDGHEVFIQSGWLRASHRALDDERSTELVPYHTHQEEDAAPLPAGELTPVRVEVFPFAHVVRPGSRLRLNVEAPGGNQPFWAFDAIDGTATNEIAHSAGRPSRVVLPRLPEAGSPDLPAELPACELAGVTQQTVSLRNQPCRPYQPARVPTAVAVAGTGTDAFGDTADLTVSWTAPSGPAPDAYRVVPAGPGAAPVEVDGASTSAVLADVAGARSFAARVQARYGEVWAPLSSASPPATVVPGFVVGSGGWEQFVRRHLRAFTGTIPPEHVVASVADLQGGADPVDWLVALRGDAGGRALVEPVARALVFALGRDPRPAELRTWVNRVHEGERLSDLLDGLAGGPYRSGTHGQFLDRVYRDVIGRPPTAQEVWSWTTLLNRGPATGTTRGRIVAQLTSSAQGRVRVAHRVDALLVWNALADGRNPSRAEVDFTTLKLALGTPLRDEVLQVIRQFH